MPDREIRHALRETRRRLRIEISLTSVILGSAAAGATFVLGASPAAALALGATAAVISGALFWRRLTDAHIARQIESGHPALQNLLITAQEALAGRVLHPVISREVFAQATARLRMVQTPVWTRDVFKRLWFAVASAAAVGVLIAQGTAPGRLLRNVPFDRARDVPTSTPSLRVTVVPPTYTTGAATTMDNPVHVQALEGSTIRLLVLGARAPVQLIEPGHEPRLFRSLSQGAVTEFAATASRVFLIRQGSSNGGPVTERLLQLQVQQDARPTVAIERPGHDLLFGSASGRVPILITARDDLNVATVSLRFTRVAGSGETFTFEEGELPLRVSPGALQPSRQATGTLVLDQLKLEDGDTLVYRALVRDDKPGTDPVASESFLIEIGKRSEASSTGFSLPEDRDRQGLSQQMLIVKTERLHAERPKLTAETVLDESRLLAAEQRMVRAEFVFMTGGEVVDEVEEAEHSHELAAGRFENAGQVELLAAIREMSRAEARLNAGDTAAALVFERAALRALERAFDRRRYFLRTLPERTRIDPSRRFAGDVSGADPGARDRYEPPLDPAVPQMRETIRALSTAIASQSGLDASLAAGILALEPEAAALQQAAIVLSSSDSVAERTRAAVEARTEIANLLRMRLGPAAAQQPLRDPLSGFLTPQVPR